MTDKSQALTKSVIRSADRLGISKDLLAQVLGVSPGKVGRLYGGRYQLSERRKEWELALLLVRTLRSLCSIVGDEQAARRWIRSENRALNGRPIDLISQVQGLVRVVHYLEVSMAQI